MKRVMIALSMIMMTTSAHAKFVVPLPKNYDVYREAGEMLGELKACVKDGNLTRSVAGPYLEYYIVRANEVVTERGDQFNEGVMDQQIARYWEKNKGKTTVDGCAEKFKSSQLGMVKHYLEMMR